MPCNSVMSLANVIWLIICATAALEVTVMVALVECVRLALAPVMVSGKDPLGVEAVVVMVSTEFPEVVVEVGLKLAVAPNGKLLALHATLPVKPFEGLRF